MHRSDFQAFFERHPEPCLMISHRAAVTRVNPAFAALAGREIAPGTPVLELKPALYHAGPDVMLAVLRHAKGDTVMMIGHNPGIAEFAHRLVSKTPVSPEFRKYPTGATLVVAHV